MNLDDKEIERYSRSMMLYEWGAEGQTAVKQAKVLIIGMGGLGGPLVQQLVLMGVGQLTLIDDDKVELHNLGRHPLFRENDIGQFKTLTAKSFLKELNPNVKIDTIQLRLGDGELLSQVTKHDLVIIGSDSLESRRQLNKVCLGLNKPWINGAAIGFTGQVAFYSGDSKEACYECHQIALSDATCAGSGVFTPVVFSVAQTMAITACAYLTKDILILNEGLQLYDGKLNSWQSFALSKNPNCICNQ